MPTILDSELQGEGSPLRARLDFRLHKLGRVYENDWRLLDAERR